jgi:anti-sigma regulatory factor (Ser/Thr protein kinase)
MATITLPAHLDSLTRGLTLVVECAIAAGFPQARITEIELAVEEALANICLYAYPDRSGEVEVRCGRDETQHFLIELIDTGVPFDLLSRPVPDLTLDTAQRQIGGFGIQLILALMDHVTYHREGERNILRLAVRLSL